MSAGQGGSGWGFPETVREPRYSGLTFGQAVCDGERAERQAKRTLRRHAAGIEFATRRKCGPFERRNCDAQTAVARECPTPSVTGTLASSSSTRLKLGYGSSAARPSPRETRRQLQSCLRRRGSRLESNRPAGRLEFDGGANGGSRPTRSRQYFVAQSGAFIGLPRNSATVSPEGGKVCSTPARENRKWGAVGVARKLSHK